MPGDCPGILPICAFPLSQPINITAPARNSPERVRDTIRTFPEKSGKPPPVWKPPGLASPNNLRLRNPGFGNRKLRGNRKPRVFTNRHPPKHLPLLVSKCIGVHSTLERSAGASFGGRHQGVWGRVRVATYENPGFPDPGFRNL